jgi:hypothetical protein
LGFNDAAATTVLVWQAYTELSSLENDENQRYSLKVLMLR